MTADTFAILCTIAPFAILLIGVTHPGLRKKHLREKFTVIRNSSVKSKHKKRVTKSAKPKYKLKDLNNVDLTKRLCRRMLGRTFVKEISSAIHRAYSLTLFILFLFSQTLLIQFLFLCPCVLFCFGGGNSIK